MATLEVISTPTRVPAGLWESLQEICWRHDNKFIEDASRILNIPASEIKRKVLGARGVVSAVVSTGGTWYDGTQCPIMMPACGEMWRRCAEPAEFNGYCCIHMKGKGMRYDNPYFSELMVRHPWKLEGMLVWVGTDKSVMNTSGEILKDIRIDITNGVCYDDRPCPPPWKKEEIIAAAMAEAAGNEED